MMLLTGSPHPVGSYYDGNGVNFSLFSAHAERVELCLFDEAGNEQRLVLPSQTGAFWHGYLPDAAPGLRYGFRLYGPWVPQQGDRFNPSKLVIDPYARQLSGEVVDSPALKGGEFLPDSQDSAPFVPKSVVVAVDHYAWDTDCPPAIPWSKTLIYELHVRGFTCQHPDIPQEIRGSYAALAHPVVIQHLRNLGITAVELQPIQQHITEPRLQRLGLKNYWGYNVLAPFAIAPEYGSGRAGSTPLTEFKDAVKALHSAGIEVILDVVFNHTPELDFQGDGPTLAQRCIDNKSYYWLDEQGNYLNWSGCGNTLRLDQAEPLQWVMDCLRYWVSECHVDGFRFDLATQLGRIPDFTANAPLLSAIRQDPLLSRCKLIAEPWDLGSGGYQLGQFPAPFAEWNDKFRDGLRQFWLQKNISLGSFAHFFSASSHYFHHQGRSPNATINLVTAHDGFTLRDLVSFNDKQNQANGENNRDGHSSNFSYNHGTEGLIADDEICQRRQVSQRNLLATLLLAQGTPQLLAGDEFGHSQKGNNNAYCQDNETTWLHWHEADHRLAEFTAELVALRKQIPALNEGVWWQEGAKQVSWLTAQGEALTAEQWQVLPAPVLQIVLSQCWLVVINPSADVVVITLPTGLWEVAMDTAVEWVVKEKKSKKTVRKEHQVSANSIQLLQLHPGDTEVLENSI